MDRYIGIDVHKESCTVVVLGPTGKRLREAQVETNGKALRAFLATIAGRKHLCIEEGTHAEWIYETLEPAVDEIVVTIPDKEAGQKSDSLDAWKRADELRRGAISRTVFKAPDRFTSLRAAAKAYRVTQRDMVRVKTRVTALYRARGINEPGATLHGPEQRQQAMTLLSPALQRLAQLLYEELDALVLAHEHSHAWLNEEAKKVPIVKLLATAPGIGEIRAAQIVATVISPHRFRTRRQFWSYCGLGIVTRSSSDWVRSAEGNWNRRQLQKTRGLNRNRQPILKAAFTGAAVTVIQQMHQHPLYQAYDKLVAAGTKPNLARLTLARRIAAAVLAMWKHKEKYQTQKPH